MLIIFHREIEKCKLSSLKILVAVISDLALYLSFIVCYSCFQANEIINIRKIKKRTLSR